MMELKKFGKYHIGPDNTARETFHRLIDGLNRQNVGQRIEQCYNFLLQERERLHKEEKNSKMIVPASRSAFIISMFAYWLDPHEPAIIYYESFRKGLFALVSKELVPALPDRMMGPSTITIKTANDHTACKELIRYIQGREPQITANDHYWAEAFLKWVTDNSQQPVVTTDPEVDGTFIKQPEPEAKVIKEGTQPYTNGGSELAPTQITIEHAPLKAAPEPLLSSLIQEVQRHILIDENVIRRIYHALLAGHVILTGPPGTGKTELARIIPETLWLSKQANTEETDDSEDEALTEHLSTETAYTTRLVTATDDWSTRTLISGIAPRTKDGNVTYSVQFGHLTATILKNWSFQGDHPEEWSTLTLQRTPVTTTSGVVRGTQRTFRGQWLVIDEFNRAPIDLALGDALTALGGNDVLRVTIENGSAELPIPQDFRIIGTLNSFDRNYLNQISEALKRRFSFVEILPPTRTQRLEEQGIVLYKALKKIAHLSPTIVSDDSGLTWNNLFISANEDGDYSIMWDKENTEFLEAFVAAWRIFEVIRIYRQLGTAQAISLFQHMLIEGVLQNYTTREEWLGKALDAALCDTITDQLQVLLPDEIEVLLLYLTTPADSFSTAYNNLLDRLSTLQQRCYAQLLALAGVQNEQGQAMLTDAQVEQIANQDKPTVPNNILSDLFHLRFPCPSLPQFVRRLRTFKAERGL
jgi:MoxR-like ATPase